MKLRLTTLLLSLLVLTFTCFNCSHSGTGHHAASTEATVEETAPPQEAEPQPEATVAGNEALHAKLVMADKIDGAEDQVVHKCGGCALAMDGDPNYTINVADYEMQFCSEYCRDKFSADPEAQVLALAEPQTIEE